MPSENPIAVVGEGALADAVFAELSLAGCRAQMFPSGVGLADLEGAAAIVIAANDDAKNVDLALTAHQRNPDLPIVVRVFDPVLEQYLARTAPGIAVNSMSAIAAPVIAGALSEVEPRRGGRWDSPLRLLSLRFDRLFVFVVALLATLTVAGTAFFSWALKLSVTDALYFVVTTITTTGYGDISAKEAPAAVKLASVAFMIAGASSIALFFAVMADWVFARRLDLALGRVPTRWQDHVIIAGAGNMTLRVAQELRARDLRAIIIERDPDTRAVARLREDEHHVVIADATKDESLKLAGADRAAAILVLTDSDAYNLHISLLGRSLNARAKILARIDSPLLSKHISAHDGLDAVSPVELAAREFAQSVLRKLSATTGRRSTGARPRA
jgi:voltage-gated potassium channel Kch